jgi:serine/threonine protein kinase/tetratricopeptide (TPR) repeat protein
MDDSKKPNLIDSLVEAALKLNDFEREEFLRDLASQDIEAALELSRLLAANDTRPDLRGDSSTIRVEPRAFNESDTQPQGFFAKDSTIGNYKIVSMLGRGGMNEVYLADDSRLRRKVAIKVLPPSLSSNEERLRRFKREAFAISGLNHPNVITIFEVGEFEGLHYIVTEYIKGKTLRQYARENRLSYQAIFEIVIQVARALAAAHGEGVVHRDIKPENIMLRPDGVVKVLDFGLAKFEMPEQSPEAGPRVLQDSSGSLSGTVVGTPKYMSPEQASGKTVDARSDIFSLGAVTYELLTGEPPFQGLTAHDVLAAVLSSKPLPIRDALPDLPLHFCEIVSRMLNRNVEDRFQTAEGLLESLTIGQREKRLQSGTRAEKRDAPEPSASSVDDDFMRRFTVERLLVGREEEKATLQGYLNAVVAGHKRFVCVTGEPGIGKTTVVEGFLDDLNQRSQAFDIGSGWCSERLDGTGAYLPFLEALDSLLHGPNGESVAGFMQRVAPTWYSQIVPQAALENVATGKRAGSQEQMKRELSAFLRQASREHPLILFIDDLHWADVSTVDLLSFLGSNRDIMRVLIIATYRVSEMLQSKHPFLRVMPDLQARGMCHEIPLRFLNVDEVTVYVRKEFPDNIFPPEFPSLVHSKTEGSPLFAVEVVRYLRDRGVIARLDGRWALAQSIPLIEKQLPPSVSGMIQRKIDRLSDDDRHLLRVASVQGSEFDSAIVAETLGREIENVEEQLEQLERIHAFVRLTGEHQFPDKTFSSRYRFVHSLYQNVLYDSLSPTRRASLSGSIGDALLERYNRNGAPIASELAILFESARQFAESATYYLVASQAAAKMFAYNEAIALSRRGLNVVKRLGVSPEQRLQEMGLHVSMGLGLMAVHGHAASDVEQTFNRARELSAEVEEGPELVPLLRGLIFFYNQRLELDKALELGEQLLRISNAQKNSSLSVEALFSRSLTFYFKGDFASAFRDGEAATSLMGIGPEASKRIPKSAVVGCRVVAASSLWVLGYPDQAAARMREAVSIAEQLAHPFSLGFTFSWAALLQLHLGEWLLAQQHAEAARAIAREHGFPLWLANADLYGGFALVNQGRLDEGIALLRQGLQTESDSGAEIGRPYSLALFAQSLGIRGDIEQALDVMDDAMELADRVPEHMARAELFRLKGELLLRGCTQEDQLLIEEATECFRQATEIARRQQAKSLELRALTSLCQVRRDQLHELKACIDAFTEGEDTADLRLARKVLKG